MIDEQALNKVHDRLYTFVTEKRVRLEDFFQQFDRLRCRYITTAQFTRALSLSGCAVTPAEVDMIVTYYSDRGDGRVNYRAFCDAVMKVERDLEKKPSMNPDAGVIKPKRTETLPLTLEKEFATELMPKMKKIVRERGLILKDYFMDFDPHRNGRVTKTQFRRCIPFELSEHEMDILVAKYEDVIVGDVNYRQLHADVMQAADAAAAAAIKVRAGTLGASASTLPTSPGGNNNNTATAGGLNASTTASYIQAGLANSNKKNLHLLTEMEKELKVVIRDKRIRLYDFFEDFDKLRSGLVTPTIFQRVLCMVGLEALRGRLSILAEIYNKPGTTMVDYVAFCRHMEADPRSYHELLHSVISRMRKEFAARGPAGLQGLQDALREADVNNRGTLGPSEFIWVLTSCGLRVTHEEVFALLDNFDVGNNGVVEYSSFVAAIRGELPPNRKKTALQVCKMLDPNNSGELILSDILAHFVPAAHPSVVAGDITTKQAYEEIATSIGGVDGPQGRHVSYEEFCSFFAMLSVNLDSDAAFEEALWLVFGGKPEKNDERKMAASWQPWASPLRATARAY